MVACEPGQDDFVVPVKTIGRHPNLFLYDPRPLWRLLGARQWDLIDLHEEPFGLAMGEVLVLRRLRRSRVPFVVASAQNLPKRYPLPFRLIERAALAQAAGAYTCNTEAGRILRDKGLVGAWTLLPLGLDTSRYTVEERSVPTEVLRIGFVGRLIPHKGVGVLLQAAVSDRRFVLEIYGDGPEAEELRNEAVVLGIEDRVTFHGFVAEDTMPEVYRTFDVLAVPSLTMPGWIEQFGRVVVEAGASGVPVVASASGSLPDVVAEHALLVPPGDAGALAAALGRLVDEPGVWEKARASGIAEAARYSWEAVADEQLALYRAATDDEAGVAG